MQRIWVLMWLVLLLAGFGLSFLSHGRWMRPSTPSPWTGTFIAVADTPLSDTFKPNDAWHLRVRFLPPDPRTDELSRQIAAAGKPAVARRLAWSWQTKVFVVPDFPNRVTQSMLASGRLPVPDAGEVLAGPSTAPTDPVEVAGHRMNVVGTLRPQSVPFEHGYVLPASSSANAWFDASDKDVKQAYVLRKSHIDRHQEKTLPTRTLIDQGKLTVLFSEERADRVPFYLYLAGVLLLLSGGSGLLIQVYLVCARRIQQGWISRPLGEIARHVRLLAGTHVVYFGLYLIASAIIYELPKVQQFLVIVVQGELSGKSGILATAGSAYGTGNIAIAAGVTLLINFLAGSLLCITLPSLVIPGCGALLAIWRATLWGVILSPSTAHSAGAMLSHNFCLLLEGEGYILATFFALLVPLYLIRSQEGSSLWARWQSAILLNLQGNLIVLVVLAVAAIYEATEIILLVRA